MRCSVIREKEKVPAVKPFCDTVILFTSRNQYNYNYNSMNNDIYLYWFLNELSLLNAFILYQQY